MVHSDSKYQPATSRFSYLHEQKVAVLTSMNRSQDIPQVYKAVEENLQTAPVSDQVSEKTQVLMRMREAIFKTFVLIGYPKVTITMMEDLEKRDI